MLTTAQLATLKTDILANAGAGGALETAVAIGDDVAVAAWYNDKANPAVKVWLPRVALDVLNSAIVWADFAALSVQKQQTYVAMSQAGFLDASDSQVRTGFGAIFGAGSASITNITAAVQRDGTRLEILFSTGSPTHVTSVFGYVLTHLEVAEALRG